MTNAFLFVAVLSIEPLWGMQDEEGTQRQQRTTAVAVAMWAALTILAVFLVGVGLLWGVSRARRLLRRREPIHTEMPDIWFLNPPEKGKPDKP